LTVPKVESNNNPGALERIDELNEGDSIARHNESNDDENASNGAQRGDQSWKIAQLNYLKDTSLCSKERSESKMSERVAQIMKDMTDEEKADIMDKILKRSSELEELKKKRK